MPLSFSLDTVGPLARTVEDCALILGNPADVPQEDAIPGEAVPVRAQLVAAGQVLGVAVGRLPATRRWARADQDLFELFALEVSAAIRNAQLYARVEAQNQRLVELDKAKDDFRLKPDSPALKLGFQPIPVDKIGPYQDDLRASWPIVEAAGAREWLRLPASAGKP